MADCSAWVGQRLAKVVFEPHSMPEGSPALMFVDNVLAHTEHNWQDYEISEDHWDNMLAQLTLLHMPVRCRVKAL